MNFTSLGLPEPILRAIADKGYDQPSPIQQQAIPSILNRQDVMAAAQTGTGKTAGFTLPLLTLLQDRPPAKSNQVRALVLTPTRELAAQVSDSIATYGKYLSLRSEVVFGGVKINPQMMKLRRGVDILVATPGRLLDLYDNNAIQFNQLEILVLDEADRMLDMGFIRDIRKILALLPQQRQNLLFSATFSDAIRELAKGLTHNAIEISVTPRNTTAKTVTQWIHPVDKKQKSALLCHLLHRHKWQQVLVFTKTKHGANRLTSVLEGDGISAVAIHGNKSQGARTRALKEFKLGKVRVLVATDIAARGLDIDQLPQVVNFDLPNVAEDYVHRIGRTGRAGAKGQAISLVCADEFKELASIERLTKQLLTRKIIDEFDPIHQLPESRLDQRPIKPKKPKKAKFSNSNPTRTGKTSSKKSPSQTKRKPSSTHTVKKASNKRPAKSGATASSRRRATGNDSSRGQRSNSSNSNTRSKSH